MSLGCLFRSCICVGQSFITHSRRFFLFLFLKRIELAGGCGAADGRCAAVAQDGARQEVLAPIRTCGVQTDPRPMLWAPGRPPIFTITSLQTPHTASCPSPIRTPTPRPEVRDRLPDDSSLVILFTLAPNSPFHPGRCTINQSWQRRRAWAGSSPAGGTATSKKCSSSHRDEGHYPVMACLHHICLTDMGD